MLFGQVEIVRRQGLSRQRDFEEPSEPAIGTSAKRAFTSSSCFPTSEWRVIQE
jgi:hypothetical protein